MHNIRVKTISLLCKPLLKSKLPASTFNQIEILKANLYRHFEATTVFAGTKNHFSLSQFSFLAPAMRRQVVSLCKGYQETNMLKHWN